MFLIVDRYRILSFILYSNSCKHVIPLFVCLFFFFSASSPVVSCPSGQYLCQDGLMCVPDYLLCDGTEQCGDGSDEGPFCCELSKLTTD